MDCCLPFKCIVVIELDFLPLRGFEHGQLLFYQCWRPPVLPSLLWCEHPLQKAEEGSTSWSPTDDKSRRLMPMGRGERERTKKTESHSHQVPVQQVQRCSRNVSSTGFCHPTNSEKTSSVASGLVWENKNINSRRVTFIYMTRQMTYTGLVTANIFMWVISNKIQ